MKSAVRIKNTTTHSEHVIMQAFAEGEEFSLRLACKHTSDQINLTMAKDEASRLYEALGKMLTSLLILIATITTAGAQVNIADTLVTLTGPVHSTVEHLTPTTTKHFGFRTPARARTWATIAGFTSITVGAYLGGKAEMKSRYFGTTSNWDAFHITRDAGLICTGMGAASLGASITIGEERPRWLPILWRLAAGAVLYRITAEATYNLTKPR